MKIALIIVSVLLVGAIYVIYRIFKELSGGWFR